jgi:5-formyltetrahydrofolate cyclo-ligase
MTTKTEIREKYRKLRDSFVSTSQSEQLKYQLAEQLKSLIPVGKDDLWFGYNASKTEADPSLAMRHGRWAFPRVEGDEIEFFLPQGEKKTFLKSKWGIMEPDPRSSLKVEIQQASGVLVPGVAFDKFGHRIGSGKGFYDRALKNYRGTKVGVALSVQVARGELPAEPFDVAMDYVVTETQVIVVKKGN